MTRATAARLSVLTLLSAILVVVTTVTVRAAPAPGACTIVSAGDIAEQGGAQDQTAAIVKALNPTAVLTLGDNANPAGSSSDFRNYYDPSWGQFKTITRPAVGHAEYQTPGAVGYLDYFAVPPFYSYDACGWHLYSLDPEITGKDRAAELAWLREDLAAHRGLPMLAAWHQPRWTSGTRSGSDAEVADLWDAVTAAGVKVVLNGNENSYERLAPMDANSQATPGGTREIIMGEGGNNEPSGFGIPLATSEKRITGVHGVLVMTLRPDGYDWRLVEVGGSIGDQGSQQFAATTTAESTTPTAQPTTSSITEGGGVGIETSNPTDDSATTTTPGGDWGATSTNTSANTPGSPTTSTAESPATPPNDTTFSAPPVSVPTAVATATTGSTTTTSGASGTVSPQSLRAFFGSGFTLRDHGSFGLPQTQILQDGGPTGGPALRVTFPAGSASHHAETNSGATAGGAQAYLALASGSTDEASLAYDLQFPAGFQFVKGGKLPGLFGGTVTSGLHIPDGTNGFSTRFMWRTNGAGEVYAYLPTSITDGTSIGRGNWTWPTGRWTHVVQHVRLNTPGSDDGTLDVWLDGSLVLHADHLRFRTVPTLNIDGLFFSTFFGGGDASWATPVTQHADFANFTASSGQDSSG